MSLLLPSYADPLSLLADRLDPPDVDVFGLLGYEPNCLPRIEAAKHGIDLPPCGQCPQELFHAATEFDVLYGGAAGGGKTIALVADDLRDAIRHPGIRIGAFRRTYDELKESLLKELASFDFARMLGAHWNGTERELRFPNKSVIRYRYLETVQDATRRQGGEYQKVTIDERTLIPPAAVSIVVEERIRSGSKVPVVGVRSGTNPGGIGHGSVRARFIEATDHGQRVYTDGQDRTVRFIQAKVDDNPKVDAGYKQRLEGISDPSRRKAMRDGNWDGFAGQFFSEWNRTRHVVRPWKLPAEWPRRAGVDWGYGAPWSVVWGARDRDGRVWLYREVYEAEVGEKDQAQRILKLDKGENVRGRHADPSMWNRRGDVHSIADMYVAEGCIILKAENDRESGWQRFHSYLDDGPLCDIHRLDPAWTDPTCPMLHVFEGLEIIDAIADAPRDEKNVEDIDTDYPHDHDLDAGRYLLMAMGLRPPRQPKPADEQGADARAARHLAAMRKPKRRGVQPGA